MIERDDLSVLRTVCCAGLLRTIQFASRVPRWEKFMATMKTLLVLLYALAASSAPGNSQDSTAATNATVINESLPVYSQMSRFSKVVRSLKKGDKVTVDLELSGAGEPWCSLPGLGGSGGTGLRSMQRPGASSASP